MKKNIAVLLLSIFFLFQAGPAVNALFSTTTTVLLIDEDKSPEKSGTEIKKDSKAFNNVNLQLAILSGYISTAFHCSEKLYPYPFLEMPVLPPNHC